MTLVARAHEAPTRPGVYFFLGPNSELLYVGKATNLRRRLLDHAHASATDVRDVRWMECADEREAFELSREIGSFKLVPRSSDADLVGKRLGVTLRRRAAP
ncbi:MAG: nucleotide excision repair endonuclease [Actinomycetota bacterium]